MTRPLARRPRAERGQTIALGAITLLIVALMTFITLNVTLSIHQKIKLQNYADAKAFSVAVQQARALNYFAYTNRAIASAYVSMANMHAYMSEAAMLADANLAASIAMFEIAAQETAACQCCIVPACCPIHCAHAIEAGIYAAVFVAKHAANEFGNAIQELDSPFRQTMTALNAHIVAIHASQVATKANVAALLLAGGNIPKLKEFNVGQAPVTDGMAANGFNTSEFNAMFFSDEDQKKRIMAEIANASRPGWTWNRKNATPAAIALFQPAMLQRLRDTAGDIGTWEVLQVNLPIKAGRTGFTDGEFPGQAGPVHLAAGDPEPGEPKGESLSSYDHGALAVQWRHGAGTFFLPDASVMAPGEITSGNDDVHRSGVLPLNSPHSGADHDSPELDLSRFMEFDIPEDAPFNQPSVYATASGSTRFNERNKRMVFEITSSGRVTFDVGGAGTGTVQLSNAGTAHAVSKAMVYYHRIGDWADMPNLFNPYWRAKLEPMTASEATLVLPTTDGDAAALVGSLSAMPGGRGAVNVQ